MVVSILIEPLIVINPIGASQFKGKLVVEDVDDVIWIVEDVDGVIWIVEGINVTLDTLIVTPSLIVKFDKSVVLLTKTRSLN